MAKPVGRALVSVFLSLARVNFVVWFRFWRLWQGAGGYGQLEPTEGYVRGTSQRLPHYVDSSMYGWPYIWYILPSTGLPLHHRRHCLRTRWIQIFLQLTRFLPSRGLG